MRTAKRTKKDYYFEFLVDTVWRLGPNARQMESFDLILLDRLYEIDYYSLVPNDDNRGEDGLEFRSTYMDHNRGGYGYITNWETKPCSVLEMLIGLSYRLEFETAQSKWEKTPKTWFWILIENLGLDQHDNRGLTRLEYVDKIEEVVSNFLERHYKGNGEGGLFPLNRPQKDQRRVEIWYQMSAYIIENYPI